MSDVRYMQVLSHIPAVCDLHEKKYAVFCGLKKYSCTKMLANVVFELKKKPGSI